MDKTWKADERAIAKFIGGERVPITGRARGATPDIAHPWLVPEVKRVKEFPKWISEAYLQALAAKVTIDTKNNTDETLPVVIIKPHRSSIKNCYVVLQLDDFMKWFGGGCSTGDNG